MLLESFFARFWPFEFLTQTDHFAKSIGFGRWPIFKMVSFLNIWWFLSGFLQRKTLTCFQNRFSDVFGYLSFWAKLTILQSLQPLQDGRFSKWSHFSNIWCFLKRFFAQNNSKLLAESFLARFWSFEFLSQTDHFAKSIAFARWPIFKMVSFWNIWCFFKRFFAQNNSNLLAESFFARFWPF